VELSEWRNNALTEIATIETIFLDCAIVTSRFLIAGFGAME
jgi:hypothetical protein